MVGGFVDGGESGVLFWKWLDPCVGLLVSSDVKPPQFEEGASANAGRHSSPDRDLQNPSGDDLSGIL